MREFVYVGNGESDPKNVVFYLGENRVPHSFNLNGPPVGVPDGFAEKLAKNSHFEEAKPKPKAKA